MKYQILFIAVVCIAFLLIGCGKQEPLSPELEALSEEASLSKKPSDKFIPWEGVQVSGEENDPGLTWVSSCQVKSRSMGLFFEA